MPLTGTQIVDLAGYVERRMGGLDRDLLPYGDPAGKDVLVFGCGLGNEVVWAAQHKAKSILGIDLALYPEPLALVMKCHGMADYPYEVRQQNIHDLTLTDERFDLIVSNGVFEHVTDLKGVLEAHRRLLRPGGRVAIYADGLWYSSIGGHTGTAKWEHLWKPPPQLKAEHGRHWPTWRDKCNRMTCEDFLSALRAVGALILQFRMNSDPRLPHLSGVIDKIRANVEVSPTDLSVVSIGCEICWMENL